MGSYIEDWREANQRRKMRWAWSVAAILVAIALGIVVVAGTKLAKASYLKSDGKRVTATITALDPGRRGRNRYVYEYKIGNSTYEGSTSRTDGLGVGGEIQVLVSTSHPDVSAIAAEDYTNAAFGNLMLAVLTGGMAGLVFFGTRSGIGPWRMLE